MHTNHRRSLRWTAVAVASAALAIPAVAGAQEPLPPAGGEPAVSAGLTALATADGAVDLERKITVIPAPSFQGQCKPGQPFVFGLSRDGKIQTIYSCSLRGFIIDS